MAAQPTFADFVAKFPPVSVPLTIGEDSHHTFGTENDPLSEAMIAQFIHPTEGTVKDDLSADLFAEVLTKEEVLTEEDEFTEYVPCFSIADTKNFVALVWWKAALLDYSYALATFTLQGELIGKQEIAYTRALNGGVSRSVVTINEEWELTIAEGTSPDGNLMFDPSTMRTRYLEILANGEVV